MNIAFTGHRDRLCDEADLDALAQEFPGAIWIHGGAIGFDRQVEQYAFKHKITTWVFKPEYEKYGKEAPLKRNLEIIKTGDFLVALYDGRKFGGTFFTLKEAKKMGKEVRILIPLKKT